MDEHFLAPFGWFMLWTGAVMVIVYPLYSRSLARRLGERYTFRQALKDTSNLFRFFTAGLMLVSSCIPRNGLIYSILFLLILFFLYGYSLFAGPSDTTEQRYSRQLIQKEREENHGFSPTLARNRRRVGVAKWVMPLLPLPVVVYLFWRGQPVSEQMDIGLRFYYGGYFIFVGMLYLIERRFPVQLRKNE